MTGLAVAELRRRTVAELRARMASLSDDRRRSLRRVVGKAAADETQHWETTFEQWGE
jgi:hypothetical protein